MTVQDRTVTYVQVNVRRLYCKMPSFDDLREEALHVVARALHSRPDMADGVIEVLLDDLGGGASAMRWLASLNLPGAG